MVLRCCEVFLVVCFRMFSLDSVIFEVFHPVWALYNIKEEVGSALSPFDSWGHRAPKYGIQHCTGCPCAKRVLVEERIFHRDGV